MIDPTPHLERFTSYKHALREFRWSIPERMNLAAEILRRHADPVTKIALSEKRFGGINTYTFGGLDFLSDKFANALSQCEIDARSRVVIALPPSAALAVAQLGCLKTGSVVVPLPPFADQRLIEHVINATHARAIILEESHSSSLREIVRFPADITRFEVRDLRPTSKAVESTKDFWSEMHRCSSEFESLELDSESPAFIFFIKNNDGIVGVVHSVRSVIGQLAAFEFFSEKENHRTHAPVYWAGDDWSSVFSLLGVLYPAWWYGCSVIANAPSDNSLTQTLLDCGASDFFLPAPTKSTITPTLALPTQSYEVYGTAETGWIFGFSEKWIESGAELSCRVVPGREIEIIDSHGQVLRPNRNGQIAIHRSDVGLYSEYVGGSKRPMGDWLLIGKSGYKDETGELHTES